MYALFTAGVRRRSAVVAGAALCRLVSWNGESRAGERSRLAGYSSGPGVCARGAGRRGDAVLLKCFELGLCLSYVSIEMFDVRPTPAVCRTRQTGTACGRLRSYSARVEIAGRAFSNVMRLSNLLSSLQACAFFSGDPDGGTESTARQSTFLRKHLVLAMLSAGRTLGLKCGSCTAAAPDCAKETSLPGLSSFDSRQSTFLQNLAITAIPELPHPHPAVLGYMERPARLQFMVGQVGLYSDHINTHNRRPA